MQFAWLYTKQTESNIGISYNFDKNKFLHDHLLDKTCLHVHFPCLNIVQNTRYLSLEIELGVVKVNTEERYWILFDIFLYWHNLKTTTRIYALLRQKS